MTARLNVETPAASRARSLVPRIGPWGGAAEWDALVRQAPDASIYHLAAWRDIYAQIMRLEPAYRVARDADGYAVGALPLVHVRNPMAHYLVSLPFLSVGGPVGSAAAATALVSDAVRLARDAGATMELRAQGPVRTDLPRIGRKIAVRLPLPDDPAVLWDAFPAKLRSQIRRPERSGLGTRFGAGLWRDFHRVYERHMHELGTPALPAAWFEALASAFGAECEVAAVYHDDEPVAAGFGFLWRETFEIVWASSLRAYNSVSPNMLLYWSMMRHVIERGARVFDFGRCTSGSGTHRFKRQWGGVDVPLPWIQWRAHGAGGRAGMPSSDGRLFRLAGSLWRRLPFAVARRLGPRIARWLP